MRMSHRDRSRSLERLRRDGRDRDRRSSRDERDDVRDRDSRYAESSSSSRYQRLSKDDEYEENSRRALKERPRSYRGSLSPDRRRGGDSRRHNEHREDKDHRKTSHNDRERSRRARDRVYDSDDDELLDLKVLGVETISEEDYFIKSAQFKYWLKDARGRYLDEMSSESAHKYFRRFVRRWNDGALKEKYYRSPEGGSPSINTAYKWSFASESTGQLNGHAAGDMRREYHDLNNNDSDPSDPSLYGPSRPDSLSATSSRPLGPTLPTGADRQLAKEAESEYRKSEYKAKMKQGYERADEMVPKSIGKEGKMAEKRATNAVNREFREKEVGGLEVDEGTLMGGGDSSFAAALRARDAAKNRREDKRAMDLADRRAAADERLAERRAKESATMDMFKALAKQRFG
ncbi:hypothetical protein BD324DRAFT_402906 [Kockovaella imperatae]|uniref:Uncharacterized protein n=1 Tax=Kockovaella imperatae TaxID=4999 RepID=A0A1Y1UIG5_9TREE|nr:hypothetical protein BD324DRAFT_402906 [Kockovaella imperatae]ORX37853.1 hypothetical protein BD324DRAFT_402906 [Kockovaella imperatae]